MVYLCGRPLPNRGRCTLGRETAIQKMVWGEDGWLRTVDGDGLPSVETEAPRVCRAGRATSARPARRLRRRAAADRFPVAAIAVARRAVQPDRASRIPAALRTRNGRQPVPAGARRAPAAVALLQRVDERRVRAAALPADGRARSATTTAPSSTTCTSRTDDAAGKHVRVMSALPDQAQADAFTRRVRDPAGCCRGTARRDRLRASPFRAIASAAPTGRGFRSSSTPASSPTKPRRPGLPNFTGAFVGMACQDMSGARAAR